jgi:hypothetical protein
VPERAWEFESPISHDDRSVAARDTMHAEPLCSRGNGEVPVMRRERQSIELMAYEQGARQVDGIE